MQAGPPFIVPDELFRRAQLGQIARAEIPGPQLCGTIGATTHPGASTGVVSFQGFPIDAYAITMTCVLAGDLGVAKFKFMTTFLEYDGSTTTRITDALLSQPDTFDQDGIYSIWKYEINITGVFVRLQNGIGTPSSFLLNDTWSVTTTASEMAKEVCVEVSDWARKYLENTGQNLTDLDTTDRRQMCEAGRVIMCSGRGEVPKIWIDRYEDARKHFLAEAKGDLLLNAKPDPDGFTFPTYERARPAFRFTYPGSCNRPVWRH